MRTSGKREKAPDALEVERRARARAELEAAAANGRLRPKATNFATEVVPELGRRMVDYQQREDQRIAAERAGRPVKPFSEMDGLEVIFAMSSYTGPAEYPPDLEHVVQRRANASLPRLSKGALERLAEINSIRQRIKADEGALWMAERLYELMKRSRSTTVVVEAARLITEVAYPPEDLQPTVEPPTPKKRGPVN
jgi:hypothetical protein